uniref:N/A n=1 Tax=Ganoderma boninense TaxID=34458 RepID=A0A5K1K8Z1_9APHY|nr:N/A [Ganoderma boninense]
MPHPYQYAYTLLAPFVLSLISPSIASDASTLEMDAPQPIAECAEDTFTWQGGLPPYTLSLRDADSGSSVFSNSGLTDTVFHWVAAVAAGTNLILELTDTGENGASGAHISESFTVEPGDDSCLSNSNSPTSSSSSSSSSSSTSTPQQTSDGTIVPSSSSPSSSSEQPTTSFSFTSPSSDSTAIATTNPSSSPSSSTGTGAPAGSTGSPSSSRTGPDGSSSE